MKSPASEEVLESRKIIMRFMDIKPKYESDNEYSWSKMPFFSTINSTYEAVFNDMAQFLEYDSDWNLIMEVVEVVENIHLNLQSCVDDDLFEKLLQFETNFKSLVFYNDKLRVSLNIKDTFDDIVKFINAIVNKLIIIE